MFGAVFAFITQECFMGEARRELIRGNVSVGSVRFAGLVGVLDSLLDSSLVCVLAC